MPLYEYKCQEGHGFESLRRMGDQSYAACPSCGGPAKVQVSMFAGHQVAQPYRVYNSDGAMVSSKQQTDWLPMMVSES